MYKEMTLYVIANKCVFEVTGDKKNKTVDKKWRSAINNERKTIFFEEGIQEIVPRKGLF